MWNAKGSGNQEGLSRRKEGRSFAAKSLLWVELRARSNSWPGNHTCKGWSEGQVWRE